MAKEKFDVVIVGGGISGIVAALKIDKSLKVLILEKNKRILQKMLATGNGKCNFSNRTLDETFYNSPMVKSVLDQNKGFLQEIEEWGVIFTDIQGRIYPKSETASGLVNVFIATLQKNPNIIIKTDEEVLSVSSDEVKTQRGNYIFKKLVVAIGSNAGSKQQGNKFSKFFKNYKFKSFSPSLVNIKCDMKYLKGLQGQRSKCRVQVFGNNKILFEEIGEVIFKNDGLSGIPILQASAYKARGENIKIILNFVFDISKNKFEDIKNKNPLFDGILVKNLYTNMHTYALDNGISDYEAASNFEISEIHLGDMNDAQVAAGGLFLNQLNLETMALKDNCNLYCVGEIVDVDGLCGGYNVTWAVVSALSAAKDINKGLLR